MLSKGFGGAERYFVDLSLALAGSGHDVQVICHKHFKNIGHLCSNSALTVDAVSPMGWWDIFTRNSIKIALARHKPEVVHAHLARAAHMAGKPCKETGIPLIVKTHNYVDLKYYCHVDCFITTTEDQKSYLLGQGIDERKIRVITNFSAVKPVSGVVRNDNIELIIASYGRLVRKKGFHVLLNAVRSVIDSGRKVFLTIGGDGPEYNSLLKLRDRLSLQQHARFCGWVEDVQAFVREADVFILPSLDEPFGIAVLEMMALGKPIIATRTKGPLEILDEHTASLIEPDNATKLATAINNFVDDRGKYLNKAENALNVFREKYTQDVVVQKLLSLYKELAGRRSD